MRAVIVTYTLRSGQRGRLNCMAPTTSDALLLAINTFGEALRTASARAA